MNWTLLVLVLAVENFGMALMCAYLAYITRSGIVSFLLCLLATVNIGWGTMLVFHWSSLQRYMEGVKRGRKED